MVLGGLLSLLTLAGCGTSSSEVSSEPERVSTRSEGEATAAFSGTVTLPTEGWNAAGFAAETVSTLSAGPGVVGFAYWDGTAYQTRSLTPEELNAGAGTRRGMWIYTTNPASLSYTGTAASSVSSELRSGWNLLAFPGSAPIPGASLVARANGSVVPLGSVVLPQFSEIQPDRTYRVVDVSAGGTLTPGQAYWVFAASAVTLSYGGTPTASPSPGSTGDSIPATLRLDVNADTPTISDDGQTVNFSRFVSLATRLYRATGSQVQQNLAETAQDTSGLDSSSDGQRTAFVGRTDVRNIPLALWTSTTSLNVSQNLNFQYFEPSLSAGGTSVAYVACSSIRQPQGNYELGPQMIRASSANADATDIVEVSGQIVSPGTDPSQLNHPSSVNQHSSPRLSSDGNLVLFRQVHSGVYTHWLYNFRLGTYSNVPLLGDGAFFLAGGGEHVAFFSATDRTGDTNEKADVFLRTLNGGGTQLVSVSSSGEQANQNCSFPGTSRPVSADGRFVLFVSEATNLVSDRGVGAQQLYVRDTQQKVTRRVALPDSAGGASIYAAISSNGKYIVVVGAVDQKTYVAQNPAVP